MIIGIGHKKGSGKDTFAQMLQYGLYKQALKTSWEANHFLRREQFRTPHSFEEFRDFSDENKRSWSKFEVRKFAKKLKLGLELDFPTEFNVEEWETRGDSYRDEIMPSLGISRREALQQRGMKIREIHSEYWVYSLLSEYNDFNRQCQDCGCKYYDDPPYGKCPKCGSKVNTVATPSNWIITDVRFPNEAEAIKQRGGILIKMERGLHTGEHPSETALDNYQGWDWVIINKNISLEELLQKAEKLLKLLNLVK